MAFVFQQGEEQCFSELRLVLLGVRGTGKTSAGNAILGTEEFNTEESTLVCLKRHNEVAGRQVTVVDTLGWRRNEPVKDTSELFKQKIVDSVSLCPPGPHAFLLVIDVVNPFTEELRRSNEEHLELFSETVWRHTIVLFTSGDQLGDRTIEEHIAKEGKALQRLVDKCENRYHVFDNKTADGPQVIKLLEKIEQMVSVNSGCHYEMDSKLLKDLEEKKQLVDERANERQLKVKRQRDTLRATLRGEAHRLSELRIVLLGWKGVGKSSAGNIILGKKVFESDGGTLRCMKEHSEVGGVQITVIDTPGWFYGYLLNIPVPDKQHILYSMSLCPPGPHVFLVNIPAVISFKEENWKSLVEHLEHLGETVWRHVMVLFGAGDKLLDASIEQHIESEGKALQRVIEKCGNRYHLFNNIDRGDGTQVTELLEKMEEMVAGNSGHYYEMDSNLLKKVEERTKAAEKRLMMVQNQRETLRALVQGTKDRLPELRTVLLGMNFFGKSTAGNLILGKTEFEAGRVTSQCVKRQAEVAGRLVSVVDTPGFLSLDLYRLISAQCISLCPPGPHAFMLVISIPINLKDGISSTIQEHMALFSESVWRYTLVLFTMGEYLGDITIEEHIEDEGRDLRWLVEKCQNRYYVLYSEEFGGCSQVKGLLAAIEEMVAGNGGDHYEMDHKISQEMEEKKATVQERAELRQKRAREDLKGMVDCISELNIVLMGQIYAGKSSAGNTILGREAFAAGRRTTLSVSSKRKVARREITVVDTPGFPYGSMQHTPRLIKQEIMRSVSLFHPEPYIVLLTISVIDKCIESNMNGLLEHMGLLSEKVWEQTIVLFTFVEFLGDITIEEFIESSGNNLQWLVEKCGNRYHVLHNNTRGDDTQVIVLFEKIEQMVAKYSCGSFELDTEVFHRIPNNRITEEKVVPKSQFLKLQRGEEGAKRKGILHLSDVRIVLLGWTSAGTSSVGNTIFGREEFAVGYISRCLKRRGEVLGRVITVVNTPGWTQTSPEQMSPELIKQEIEHSVSLCPPGPHAFLLVIPSTQRFTHVERTSIEEHLEVLGESIWNHIILLFTRAEWLGDEPIERYTESEGGALQHLIKKCKKRYHALDTKIKGDSAQVKDLLEKIEDMVAENTGRHYRIEGKTFLEEEKRPEEEEMEMPGDELENQTTKTLSNTPRVLPEEQHQLSELRIVLLGFQGVGKSSTGNTILNREEFSAGKTTVQCVKREGEVAGRKVTVVDTPGLTSVDQGSPELLKQEIVRSVYLCPPGPHSFLFVINLPFQKLLKNSFTDYPKLFNETLWRCIIVVFINKDFIGYTTTEQDMESQGAIDPWFTEKFGKRYHILNNFNSGDGTQVTKLLEKIEEMVSENGGYHFEMDSNVLQEIEMKSKAANAKAEQRIEKVKKQGDEAGNLRRKNRLSEVKILLLGLPKAGKSSAGNTILGKYAFDTMGITMLCKRKQSSVAGRKITVVDTMGWLQNDPIVSNSKFYRQELVKGMSMFESESQCNPGPQAFLLVIDSSFSFTKKNRHSMEDLLNFFSKEVWRHTIILFTKGGWLGHTPIEQYIESEGESLQWLVEKCGNRYHVFYDDSVSDRAGVPELLDKIEEMVAIKGGHHYEMDINIFTQVEEQQSKLEKKVQLREIREKAMRFAMNTTFQTQREENHLSDVRILLLGLRISGKSSAGNTILGRKEFLDRTAECLRRQGKAAGRQVTVVDTPGWWFNETEPKLDKQKIIHGVSLCAPGPHAILLVINVGMAFTEKHRKSVMEYLEPLPLSVWRHTIVLFTWGDHLVDSTIRHHIEREGKALQWIVEKCGHRYQVFNNMDRGDRAQVNNLMEKIERMVDRNNGKFFKTTEQLDKEEDIEEGMKERPTKEVMNSTEEILEPKFEENWMMVEEQLWKNTESTTSTMSGQSSTSDYVNSFELHQMRSHDRVSEWLRNNFPDRSCGPEQYESGYDVSE